MSKDEWVRKLIEGTSNNSCTVTARLGRAGSKSVKWGHWQSMELHVQKNHKGEIVLITPKSPPWAEYDPRRYDLTVLGNGNALFTAEDWYLELSKIISKPASDSQGETARATAR